MGGSMPPTYALGLSSYTAGSEHRASSAAAGYSPQFTGQGYVPQATGEPRCRLRVLAHSVYIALVILYFADFCHCSC